MKKTLPEAVKQLMQVHDYDDVMNEALSLIINGKMNSFELDNVLKQQGIRRITDIKERTLNVILDYAEMILDDHFISSEEIKNLKLLKLFFRVEEGDFQKNNKTERVNKIISTQLDRLYADKVLEREERLHQSELQGIFGFGHDEYMKIVNTFVEKAIANGANKADLDTYVR